METKMVCVSGYFDPIHVGHLEYIKLASKLGDKLVVILNNDYQAKLKKGKPFMKQEDRIKIIKALKYVDEVVLSIDKDLSVCKTLAKIRPAIFAKGGDRTRGNIPEAEICKKLGIKVIDGLGKKIRNSKDYYKQ
jgi:D-beta-D-heptose 7-phosphate kinase/D-beta-D-heptose 1-phosphate adenosyltransferase